MAPVDLDNYTGVRVADEIVVNLRVSTCGITYDEAVRDVEVVEVDGVPIPFASAPLMLPMKQTGREKDALDLMFLERLVGRGKTRTYRRTTIGTDPRKSPASIRQK